MSQEGVDLRDPAAVERFEAEHPEEALRRREFLARTAALAGGVSLAGMLAPDDLVNAAARIQHRTKLPSPRNLPIDTFVILMMENRSFDHYFGWHPKADARNAGLSYPDAAGNPVATHHLTPDFQGCDFRDPDHSWYGGRHQWDHGRLDGFVQGNDAGDGSDSYAAGYYLKQDLAFIPHAADAFQLYDRFHCSIMASTYPNRHYMWGAQSGGQIDNQMTVNNWETIFDRAKSKGVSATYFNSDLPFSALYGPRGLSWTQPVANYYQRAANGTLSNINFVDPAFRRRRRRRRDLRRRASPRRHPDRAGVHVRRRARLHRLAAVQARGAVHRLRRVGWLLRPREAPLRPRRPPQPRRQLRLRDDRLPGPRGCRLAVGQAQRRQPRLRRLRVDPEADLLPLRARVPQQAPPLRDQHRPHASTGSHPTTSAPTCPTRRRSPARRAACRGCCARASRSATSRTTWSTSRHRASSTGSATTSSRPPTRGCSATPTASSGRCGRARPTASGTREAGGRIRTDGPLITNQAL